MNNLKFHNKRKPLRDFNSNSPGFYDRERSSNSKPLVSNKTSLTAARCSEKTVKFNNENAVPASPVLQKFRSNTIIPHNSRKYLKAIKETKDLFSGKLQGNREILVEDLNIDFDLSSIRASPQRIQLEKQLEDLKIQVKSMNEKLSIDERRLLQKNLEYDYLRNYIFNLQKELDNVRISRSLKTDNGLCCCSCKVM